jgi:hypothetical protein
VDEEVIEEEGDRGVGEGGEDKNRQLNPHFQGE